MEMQQATSGNWDWGRPYSHGAVPRFCSGQNEDRRELEEQLDIVEVNVTIVFHWLDAAWELERWKRKAIQSIFQSPISMSGLPTVSATKLSTG